MSPNLDWLPDEIRRALPLPQGSEAKTREAVEALRQLARCLVACQDTCAKQVGLLPVGSEADPVIKDWHNRWLNPDGHFAEAIKGVNQAIEVLHRYDDMRARQWDCVWHTLERCGIGLAGIGLLGLGLTAFTGGASDAAALAAIAASIEAALASLGVEAGLAVVLAPLALAGLEGVTVDVGFQLLDGALSDQVGKIDGKEALMAGGLGAVTAGLFAVIVRGGPGGASSGRMVLRPAGPASDVLKNPPDATRGETMNMAREPSEEELRRRLKDGTGVDSRPVHDPGSQEAAQKAWDVMEKIHPERKN